MFSSVCQRLSNFKMGIRVRHLILVFSLRILILAVRLPPTIRGIQRVNLAGQIYFRAFSVGTSNLLPCKPKPLLRVWPVWEGTIRPTRLVVPLKVAIALGSVCDRSGKCLGNMVAGLGKKQMKNAPGETEEAQEQGQPREAMVLT
jgi:hypothetical protein